MLYAPPGSPNAKVIYKPRYDNFIGGKFVAPVKGGYFDVLTPITGKPYTQAARSTAEDIELALMPPTPQRRNGGALRRPNAPTSCSRSPTASSKTWKCWPTLKPWTTARPSAKP